MLNSSKELICKNSACLNNHTLDRPKLLFIKRKRKQLDPISVPIYPMFFILYRTQTQSRQRRSQILTIIITSVEVGAAAALPL